MPAVLPDGADACSADAGTIACSLDAGTVDVVPSWGGCIACLRFGVLGFAVGISRRVCGLRALL